MCHENEMWELRALKEGSDLFADKVPDIFGVDWNKLEKVDKGIAPARFIKEIDMAYANDKYLHIVVQGLPAGLATPIISFLERRAAYLKQRTGAPSKWAHLAEFAKLQDKQEYLCNRPCDAADPAPVTLLEPIFAEFVDDCREYQPTVEDDDFMHAFSKLFRYLEIELDPATIGSTKRETDGHLLSTCGKFAVVVAVEKNEIGSGGGDPFTQAILCHRQIIQDSWVEITKFGSIVPSLLIIVFDVPMQETAIRTLGALKQAVEELQDLYSKPELIPRFRDEILVPTTLRKPLIFFGETINDAARRKLCIKFVRHYSREAHDFCAEKGHAPKLIACNHLSAGWIMVVMDALDIDDGYFSQRPGTYRRLTEMTVSARQSLQEPVISLIQQLHEYGYVHGDLRDTNFFFMRDDKRGFMLIDFDWAGPIGSTRYPMYVNWQLIDRPKGARGWEMIKTKHNLEMLSYMFCHKHWQDDWEATSPSQRGRAAKRRRILSNGEEPIDTE
ncbi:hypothetical protein AZE42_02058 [Rhizopogon vesiculosus]|uniref:Protein kinase domain-containing protein n=1 Tax=Rhizopogon vesiculosus TaxID=180088 RepID=A0A1J8PS38_9AGAM|nr:hypothetical protein AZE42_02058 [Rhizopogon vesiculosus]